MKAALILAAVGAAVAQDLSGIPACATGCLATAITKAGCNPTDQACQCGPTSSAIGSLALDCLLSSCNASQLVTVQSVGSELCVEYSLTAKSTTGGSTAASTTASVGSTASTVASSTTSSAAASTSASASQSSSAAATTVTSTAVVSSNSTVTSHSPTAQSTNAAAAPVFVGVGALAAFLGVVAAL